MFRTDSARSLPTAPAPLHCKCFAHKNPVSGKKRIQDALECLATLVRVEFAESANSCPFTRVSFSLCSSRDITGDGKGNFQAAVEMFVDIERTAAERRPYHASRMGGSTTAYAETGLLRAEVPTEFATSLRRWLQSWGGGCADQRRKGKAAQECAHSTTLRECVNQEAAYAENVSCKSA